MTVAQGIVGWDQTSELLTQKQVPYLQGYPASYLLLSNEMQNKSQSLTEKYEGKYRNDVTSNTPTKFLQNPSHNYEIKA